MKGFHTPNILRRAFSRRVLPIGIAAAALLLPAAWLAVESVTAPSAIRWARAERPAASRERNGGASRARDDDASGNDARDNDAPRGRNDDTSLAKCGPDLRTKIVPVVSAGNGLRLGAAQVTGPERNVDDVVAVAEIETEWKRAARVRLYVPISDINVLKGIHRVPRVGVSGIADIRLKF